MSRPRSSVPSQNSVLGGLGSPSGVSPVVRYCVSTPCPVSEAERRARRPRRSTMQHDRRRTTRSPPGRGAAAPTRAARGCGPGSMPTASARSSSKPVDRRYPPLPGVVIGTVRAGAGPSASDPVCFGPGCERRTGQPLARFDREVAGGEVPGRVVVLADEQRLLGRRNGPAPSGSAGGTGSPSAG